MQDRQFPDSTSEEHRSVGRVVRFSARSRRLQGFAAGASALLLGLLATGCPGAADLTDPNSYDCPPEHTPDGTGKCVRSGGSAGSGGGGSTDACLTACVTKVFETAGLPCTSCHGMALQSAGLDLQSPGVSARLRDAPATFKEVMPPATPGDCPPGAKLIDSANPSASWLLTKIKGMQKTCGAQMPPTPLSAEDIACLEMYAGCVAKPAGGGGSGAGGSGGGGGSGGAATGGGGSGGAATGGGGSGGAATGGGGSGGTSGGSGGTGGA